MNMFFRRSINEYRRQISLKESFTIQTERMRETVESVNWTKFEEPPTNRRQLRRRLRLLLLSPLVEIAWADGRVTRRESDAILQVAAAYGLIKDEAGYCELLEKLTSRPISQTVARMWRDFHGLFVKLSEYERGDIAIGLDVQAQFVAEQSSDNLIAFLRGERVSESEHEALLIVKQQLETAEAAARSREKTRNAAALRVEQDVSRMPEKSTPPAQFFFSESKLEATLEDYSKLVPLVPLVKTAWAEGRVTKRERHLIFEAAARMGIKPDTAAHRRLAEWLELHPTDEFYGESLERLNTVWKNLTEEERTLRRLDLLSDCVNVAEASGGTKNYPSGGARICDEEIAAVKYIAQKLNPTAANAGASVAVAR